ncbi:MAG: Spy/CpxP family protein refolding chaperone [Planctomycetota bacterium]
MKPMRTFVLTLMTTALVTTAALAQPHRGRDNDRPRPAHRRDDRGDRDRRGLRDRGPRDRGPRDRQADRGRPPRETPPPRLEQVLRQLDLTESHREQIDRILQDARRAGRRRRTEAAEAFHEAMCDLRQAHHAGDDEAFDQALQRLEALRDQRHETLQDIREQIEAVLTPEQRERLDRLMGPGGRFDAFVKAVEAIDLQGDQERKVRDIAADADTQAKAQPDLRRKGRIYRQAHETIRDLLTDEQKDHLQRRLAMRMRRRRIQRMFADLNLTAEQRQAVEAIHAEVREQVTDTDSPQARRGALREGHRRIITEVLTDEQRRQLREQMRDRFGPGEPRGPRDGRRDGRRGPRDGRRGPREGDRGPREPSDEEAGE